MRWLALPMLTGLVLESFGSWRHARYLQSGPGEGSAAWQEQVTGFGKTWIMRNVAMAVSFVMLAWAFSIGLTGSAGLVIGGMIAVLVTLAALVGRAMFYVLVIPTTMPGAFFWKNPAFQEHARDSGLAGMSQTGVQAATH
jgi:hypothetical protein